MRYLVTINIPYAVDDRGIPHTDPLWAKDIELHAAQVSELIIAAPEVSGPPREGWVAVPPQGPDHARNKVRFVPVPAFDSEWAAWLGRSAIDRAMSAAIAEADVVQTNVAGWPLPLGWIAGPRARAVGKPVVVNVESAPWRTATGLGRIRAVFYERMARREVQQSDIAFFTHAGYRDELLDPRKPGPRAVHVVHATWIDESFLIEETALCARLAARRDSDPLRMLFASRIVADKGVETLLTAISALSADDQVVLTVMGQGELLPQVRAVAARFPNRVQVREPAPYGEAFLRVIDAHDCLVVPTLSDEQPRVVYDAFARGVPVIASDTAGNQACVDETTGWLFPVGDATALAAVLRMVAAGPTEAIARRGLQARAVAAGRTHRAMHVEGQRKVEEALRSPSD